MLKNLARFAISFSIVFAAYWAYAMLAVPTIEPELRRELQKPDLESGIQGVETESYRDLFPAGSWELDTDTVKVIKTHQGRLLFQDEKFGDDGEIILTPITLIAEPTKAAEDGAEKQTRAIVMQAPEAVLKFAGKFNPLMGSVAPLEAGVLKGDITIRSPAPTVEDLDLTLQTRNVQITSNSIWTKNQVAFRYGSSEGQGRDLYIALSEDAGGKGGKDKTKNLGFGTVEWLRVTHVDYVNLAIPGSGVLPDASTATLTPAADAALLPPTATRQSTTPIRVTCQGPFHFNLQEWNATFAENVVVARPGPVGQEDQLKCQLLTAFFRSPKQRETASATEGQEGANVDVTKIVATGNPVTLLAPSVNAYAQGTKLEVQVATRLIHLSGPSHVTLRHGSQIVVAPQVEYLLPEDPKRIGQLWAPGPGYMVGRDDTGKGRAYRVDWNADVRLRRQGEQHVLSLNGGVVVDVEGVANLRSGTAHIWLDEVPEVGSLTAGVPPSQVKARYNVRPDRLLLQDHVTFDSQKLQGATHRVECQLLYRTPSAPPQVAPTSTTPETESSQEPLFALNPEQGESDQSGQGPSESDQKLSKYDLMGDAISATILAEGEKKHLEQLTIEGNARFIELPTDTAAPPPLLITGKTFQLQEGSTSDPEIRVLGQPATPLAGGGELPEQRAVVNAEGVLMSGLVIRMRQTANRFWVDGPGDIRTTRTVPAAGQTAAPGQLEVSWTGGLDFDGLTAIVSQNVVARGQQRLKAGEVIEYTAQGQQLDVSLSRRVSFANPKANQGDVEARLLAFRHETTVENRTFDVNGAQQSLERGMAHNLRIDQAVGEMRGDGPGWMRTVRYGDQGRAGGRALPALQRGSQQRLVHVSVEFDQQVIAQFRKKEVRFLDDVRVVYGPVSVWDESIDPNAIFERPGYGVAMTCRQLMLTDFGRDGTSAIEMDATGNVRVDGRADLGFFVAQAPRIKYSEVNDRLVLEGSRGADARVETWEQIGEKPQVWESRSIEYWPKINAIKMPDFRSGEIFNIGKKSPQASAPVDNVDPRGSDLFNPSRPF